MSVSRQCSKLTGLHEQILHDNLNVTNFIYLYTCMSTFILIYVAKPFPEKLACQFFNVAKNNRQLGIFVGVYDLLHICGIGDLMHLLPQFFSK